MPVNAVINNLVIDENVRTYDITLGESVFYVGASDFTIERISGDMLNGLQPILFGSGNSYKLELNFPKDRKGSLRITPTGTVLKTDGTDDTLQGSQVVLQYNTTEPKIIHRNTPGAFNSEDGADLIFGYNVKVTGLGVSDFDFVGVDIPTPILYRSTHFGNFTDLPLPTPVIDPDHWVEDVTGSSITETIYFLLRIPPVSVDPTLIVLDGDLKVYIKPGAVRGPIQ